MDLVRSGVDRYRAYLSSLTAEQREDLAREVDRVERDRGY